MAFEGGREGRNPLERKRMHKITYGFWRWSLAVRAVVPLGREDSDLTRKILRFWRREGLAEKREQRCDGRKEADGRKWEEKRDE